MSDELREIEQLKAQIQTLENRVPAVENWQQHYEAMSRQYVKHSFVGMLIWLLLLIIILAAFFIIAAALQ